MATFRGPVPVVRSVFGAKLIVPDVLVFLKIETELLVIFVTARSGLPSASRSPMAQKLGSVPVGKSTLVANELAIMVPAILTFLNADIVLLTLFTVTTSNFPSPSRSSTFIPWGFAPVVRLI